MLCVAASLCGACSAHEDQLLVDEGRACVRHDVWGPFSSAEPHVEIYFDYCVPCEEEVLDVGCQVSFDPSNGSQPGRATIEAWADIEGGAKPLFCGECTPLRTTCEWPLILEQGTIEVTYGNGPALFVRHPFDDDTDFCVDGPGTGS